MNLSGFILGFPHGMFTMFLGKIVFGMENKFTFSQMKRKETKDAIPIRRTRRSNELLSTEVCRHLRQTIDVLSKYIFGEFRTFGEHFSPEIATKARLTSLIIRVLYLYIIEIETEFKENEI
uniref:Uncharacterized protein n=1 Tax=Glossina austeni TaxID=7395 RepID=A0A1A9VC18_GLOAU